MRSLELVKHCGHAGLPRRQGRPSYAAPYVNRIDNMGYNGVAVAKEIHDIFRANDLSPMSPLRARPCGRLY